MPCLGLTDLRKSEPPAVLTDFKHDFRRKLGAEDKSATILLGAGDKSATILPAAVDEAATIPADSTGQLTVGDDNCEVEATGRDPERAAQARSTGRTVS